MAFKVLNADFIQLYEVEAVESIIWTDRYLACGDFEIYAPATDEILDNINIGNYLFNTDSYDPINNTAELMIIESAEITTTFEDGAKVKFTGRNLKSILDRRIVWNRTTFVAGTSAYTVIKSLLNDNVIAPTQSARRIPELEFVEVSRTWPTLSEDFTPTGQDVLDAINQICEQYELGYRVYIDLNTLKFKFKMIVPIDRTYSQHVVPPVIFSPGLENLAKSNYVESSTTEKNVILVADEGDEEDRITVVGGDDTLSGLYRKETYASISNLEWAGDRTKYLSQMRQKGNEELLQMKYTQSFDGEADNGRGYIYGRDYTIGDIVELRNEFGFSGTARLVEMITSVNASGITLYPSFTSATVG